MQFRAELFNAFNHTNLNNPNAAQNNTNFGRILGSGGARVVQFGLKYVFRVTRRAAPPWDPPGWRGAREAMRQSAPAPRPTPR